MVGSVRFCGAADFFCCLAFAERGAVEADFSVSTSDFLKIGLHCYCFMKKSPYIWKLSHKKD